MSLDGEETKIIKPLKEKIKKAEPQIKKDPPPRNSVLDIAQALEISTLRVNDLLRLTLKKNNISCLGVYLGQINKKEAPSACLLIQIEPFEKSKLAYPQEEIIVKKMRRKDIEQQIESKLGFCSILKSGADFELLSEELFKELARKLNAAMEKNQQLLLKNQPAKTKDTMQAPKDSKPSLPEGSDRIKVAEMSPVELAYFHNMLDDIIKNACDSVDSLISAYHRRDTQRVEKNTLH